MDINPKDVNTNKKISYSCIPSIVIAELAVAMLEGARKYGRHNYRVTNILSSVYTDATKRHIDAYIEGEDIDKDSGLHHITKAIASLVVLRDSMIQNKIIDDRPPKSPKYWMELLNEKVEEIIKEHPDCKQVYIEGDQNGN